MRIRDRAENSTLLVLMLSTKRWPHPRAPQWGFYLRFAVWVIDVRCSENGRLSHTNRYPISRSDQTHFLPSHGG